MRREGRQHGWVFTVDRSLVDQEGKCRARAVQVEGAVVANGGFVRAPRKPTNHSKPAVGRAYKGQIGKGSEAGSGRGGRHKFKHDEVKMYYLEGADDGAVDVYDVDTRPTAFPHIPRRRVHAHFCADPQIIEGSVT